MVRCDPRVDGWLVRFFPLTLAAVVSACGGSAPTAPAAVETATTTVSPAAARNVQAAVTAAEAEIPPEATDRSRLTVRGRDFQQGLSVIVSGPGGTSSIAGNAIVDLTETSFQMAVPLVEGRHTIVVTNPGGPASERFGFSVEAPPP